MPKASSNSVKVFYANKENVEAELKRCVARLVRAHPEIKKVVHFGSYATDRYGPASDVDLLLILERASGRMLDRIPHYLPEGLSLPVDVFPYTQAEIDTMLADGNPFIRRALAEGKVLYERAAH